jgi:hypothetical protein
MYQMQKAYPSFSALVLLLLSHRNYKSLNLGAVPTKKEGAGWLAVVKNYSTSVFPYSHELQY